MSSEVGSAHISIFPVMTGFRSKVNQEVKSTGDEASNSFKKSFQGAGGISGRQLGQQLKESFSQSSKGLADQTLKVFTDDVNAATDKLSKARNKQADDAGKVRVAEARLQEAMDKYGEGSSQVIAAEERLASARRRSEISTAAVKDATNKLASAQESAARAEKELSQYSDQSGNAFQRAMGNFKAGLGSLEAGKSSITGIAGALGSLTRSVSGIDIWGPFAAKAKSSLDGVVSSVRSFASVGVSEMRGAASTMASAFSDGLSSVRSRVSSVMSGIASKLPEPIRNVCSGAHEWFSNVVTAAQDIFGKLPEVAQTAAGGIKSALSTGLSGLKTIASGVWDGFKSASTATVGVAAGVTVALGKMAATGGFNRALSIEQARAKLTGLGHDASSVDEIMNNALASVKGTAYGLGDAATTAAQLVASGVQQGDQLTGVLKTVGDSAQISGRDFTEMGSIFSKVAASNKLQGEQVNQILDSGIPILQFLAKHYGITAEAAQQMVSDGKVDFENFAAAMQENLGGAAQSAGSTFEGAMANAKAALSRLGEKAMTPILNGLRDVFNAAIPLVDAVTAKLGPAFEQWGSIVSDKVVPLVTGAFEKLTSMLNSDSFSGFSGALGAILPVVASVVAAVGGSGLMGVIGNLLGQVPIVGTALQGLADKNGLLAKGVQMLGSPLGAVIALIAGLVAVSPELQSTLGQVAQLIGSSIMNAIQSFAPLFQQIVTSLTQAAQQIMPVLIQCLGQIFATLGPVVEQLIPVLAECLQPIIECLAQIIDPLTNIIVTLLPPLTEILNAVIVVLGDILSFLGQVVAGVIALVMPCITSIVQAVSDLLTQCQPWLEQLGDAFSDAAAVIGSVLSIAGNVLLGFLSVAGEVIAGVVSWLAGTLEPAFSAMQPFITGVINAVNTVIKSLEQIVRGVVQVVSGLIHGDWSQVWQGFQNIVSGAVGALGGILDGIYQAVMAAVSGAGTWLENAGSQIISGLWNGISGAVDWLYNKVCGALNGLVDSAMKALGIHSPSRVFRDKVGQYIPKGIAVGIEGATPELLDTVDGMTAAVAEQAEGAGAAMDFAAGLMGADGSHTSSESPSGGLSVEDIVVAIVTALKAVGAIKLDIDLKTLAMVLTPFIDAELGKREVLGV